MNERNGVSLASFRSRDPDETRAHVRRYGEHSRVIHGRKDFVYGERTAATRQVTIGRVHRSFRQTLRAAVRWPTLILDQSLGGTVRFGRRKQFRIGPSCALINVPDQEYLLRSSAGDGIALRVEPGLLESEIDTRVAGTSRRWLLHSVSVPVTVEQRSEPAAMLAQMLAAAGSDGSWGSYGNLTTFERAAAGWMAELLVEASGVRPVTDVSLHRLARLRRWIDEHLADDITLDRLCAVAGVSWRTLQKTMLAVHGQSPLEFVHARRLAAVRRRLEDGSSRAQVAAVALDCGFRHLGRFSASYRTAFGELPSETARARRQG